MIEHDVGDEDYGGYEEHVGFPFMQFDKFERHLVVRCCWCKEVYPACVTHAEAEPEVFGKLHGKQGYRCAAAVFKIGDQWHVQGYYGSTMHDLCLYRFVHNDPPGGKADPVCDRCIDQQLECGNIVLVSENGYGELT